MRIPFISCLCPTYKRPEHLANVVACFEAQCYPKNRCELIISDDAGQYRSTTYPPITVDSSTVRFPNLPEKFNYMSRLAKGDILAVWEDDDIYLPDHLSKLAGAYRIADGGKLFFTPETVYSTYGKPIGEFQTENCGGRFHASWAYSRELWDELGGYSLSSRLTFDAEMRERSMRYCQGVQTLYGGQLPTYVYRWGNGIYHGSQAGDNGYQALWDSLEKRPAPFLGAIVPRFDLETTMIYNKVT